MGYQIRLLYVQASLLFFISNGDIAFGRGLNNHHPLNDVYPEDLSPVKPIPGMPPPIDLPPYHPEDLLPVYPGTLPPSYPADSPPSYPDIQTPLALDSGPIFLEYIKLTLPSLNRPQRPSSRLRLRQMPDDLPLPFPSPDSPFTNCPNPGSADCLPPIYPDYPTFPNRYDPPGRFPIRLDATPPYYNRSPRSRYGQYTSSLTTGLRQLLRNDPLPPPVNPDADKVPHPKRAVY